MASKSVVSDKRECYICGKRTGLERHHIMHGTANRKKAEEDGLWVYLCRECHTGPWGVHGYHGHEYDNALKRLGEWQWLSERGYIRDDIPRPDGIAAFVTRYGKNYL